MKKLNLFLLPALALLSLAACDNDSDGDYYTGIALVSVMPLENGSYYFQQDNGQSIYPSINLVSNYKIQQKDQRAFIYYKLLNAQEIGYDYNIKLYGIENILTKDILIISSQDELDKIGDDPINITKAWVGDGYLNVCFQFPFTPESKPHYINIIQNKIDNSSISNFEDGIVLEFRHNAYNNINGILTNGVAAFKLNDTINPNNKNIYLRIKTLSGNIIYQKI